MIYFIRYQRFYSILWNFHILFLFSVELSSGKFGLYNTIIGLLQWAKTISRESPSRSSGNVAKAWNFFFPVCQFGTQLGIKKMKDKIHRKKPSTVMMPQSNLFYCSSSEEIGIAMAGLCLWKIGSAGGHASVCLTGFAIILSAYIWILLRLVFVRLNISAGLCCYDMTRGETVLELHCADVDYLISTVRFQTI